MRNTFHLHCSRYVNSTAIKIQTVTFFLIHPHVADKESLRDLAEVLPILKSDCKGGMAWHHSQNIGSNF